MRVFMIAVTAVVCLVPGLAAGQTVRGGVTGGIQWSSLDVEGLVTTVEAGTGGPPAASSRSGPIARSVFAPRP